MLGNLFVPYFLLGLVALAFLFFEIRHRRSSAGARSQPSPRTARLATPPLLEAPWARGVLFVCACWAACVFLLYARLALPWGGRQLLAYLPQDTVMRFLLAQGIAFCVVAIVTWIVIPRASAIATTLVLIASSVALVALMRPWSAVIGFVGLAAWAVCATGTMRWLVLRWAGAEFADWGTVACTLGAFGIFVSFGLAAAHLMTYRLTALLAIALALPGLWRAIVALPRVRRFSLDRLRAVGPIGQVSMEAMWILLAVAFVVASGPETGSDSIHRYLPHIRGIAAHHGLFMQTADVLWLRPEAVQTFMAAAFVLGATVMAKWLSWATLLALAVLLVGELKRRSVSTDLAWFGAAAIVSCPLLLWSSTTLYIDHVLVWLYSGAFLTLARALESGSRRALILSAVIMAAAAQARQNVLLAAAIWLAALVWHAFRSRPSRPLRSLVVPAASALAAFAAPWYLYTYVTTGNPVFPYLNSVFHSTLWPASLPPMSVLAMFSAGKSWISHAVFPWTAVFHTSRLVEAPDGYLGFWVLALLPLLLVVPRLRPRCMMFLGSAGILIILSMCAFTEYARYWLPGLPLVLIAAVVTLAELWRRAGLRASPWVARGLALLLLAALLVPVPLWNPRFVYGDLYVGRVSEDEMLASAVPGYAVARDINRLVRPGEGTFCTGFPQVGLLKGPAYEMPFWKVVSHLVPGVGDFDSFDAFADRNRIRYWIVDRHGPWGDPEWFNDLMKAKTRYWVDERLVSASGTTAAYWLGREPSPRHFRAGGAVALPESGWVSSGAVRASGIVPATGATIEQEFDLPKGADLLRIAFTMSGERPANHVLLASILWRDTLGNPLPARETFSELSSAKDTFECAFYSTVVAGASVAQCRLRSYQSEDVHVDRTTVEWLAAVPRDASHAH